jgi:RNA polymerase sigma factor for flagellar operon FliA
MTALPIAAEQRAKGTLDREAYEHYLPMVRRAAMRLARTVPRHITVADLVGYGWVGLIEAYRRADPGMPSHEFDAYASYRIRGAMIDYLRSLDPATREVRRASRQLTQTLRALTAQLGRPPEEEEISTALGIDCDAYRALLLRIANSGMARLELIDLDEIESETLPTMIEDDVSKKELAAAVADAIDALPSKIRQVLTLYYQEECTLREIGAVLGVSESRVSQLHSEAMHRLRAMIGRD